LYDVSDGFEQIGDEIPLCKIGGEDKTQAVYEHTAYFDAEVPYQITAWQNSVDLNSVENLREKVEAAYKKLCDMITQKQYDAFMDCVRERENRVAVSMYLDKESRKEIMESLIAGFEPIPFSGTETMNLYADGKLVCLTAEDGNSALRFFNKKTGEEMILDIMFHLKKGDTELSVSP